MSLCVSFGIFLLGLCFGSFGNVVIARVPLGISVVRPRSRCPNCKKQIRWFDNIPVLSFLWLKAKCRSCHVKISWRYPTVELLSGLLFVGLFNKLGLTVTFFEWVILGWGSLVASFIDLDHRILPDVMTLPGIGLGLLGAFLNPDRTVLDAVLGIVAGGGFLWSVAFIYQTIRHEEGMGGGDIKLLAWIGSVLGWKSVVFSIIVSSLLGSAVGGGYALLRKSGMKTAIPFGPFLALAALLFMFVGQTIIDEYIRFFLPFASNS